MAVVNVGADVSRPGSTVRTLIEQIRAEYAEMPGLSVTLPTIACAISRSAWFDENGPRRGQADPSCSRSFPASRSAS